MIAFPGDAPIALATSAGHGYLPLFGVMTLAIALAQIMAVLGWGEYFPWSISGLLAQGEQLGAASYVIVLRYRPGRIGRHIRLVGAGKSDPFASRASSSPGEGLQLSLQALSPEPPLR